VDNETVECWAHGAKFDLNTGKPLSLPAYEPVATYEVLIDNNDIYVEYE
jgi:3-phenylpropionate/trans-cinnamate dioxygenase ferredoxin subunit